MSRLETVWMRDLSAADGEAYDAFVAEAAGGHYFQTRCWAGLVDAERPVSLTYFIARRGTRVIGSALILRRRLFGMVLPSATIERGPVCDDPETLPDVLGALLGESRSHGILRLRVMPYWSGEAKSRVEHLLRTLRFNDVQRPDGPHVRSLRLDLASLSSNDPFNTSALAKVRREIRRAERAGASVRRGALSDLPRFREWHEERLRREGHRLPHPAWYDALGNYFLSDERGAMFVAEYRHDVIAMVFVARLGAVATFSIGESTTQPLPFPKMIGPLSAAIFWAKMMGLTTFDLGGIPMEGDIDPKRASIADFKRGFSRSEISYVHAHARWL